MKLPATITVNVTDPHIHAGKKLDCQRCPIALAVSEQALWATRVEVGLCTSLLEYIQNGQRKSATYAIPSAAYHFIDDFDREYRVTPFTFTMTLVTDLSEIS